MANYEIVDHTADWALRVWGQDLADLLLQAAWGMNRLMVGDTTWNAMRKRQAESFTIHRDLEIDAFDSETLLVDWLTDLAFFAEMEQLVFPHITLTNITPTHLNATIQGSFVPELVKHIKAVTYHNLAITEIKAGLEATIVFDV
jgi:SHS2 domain-containing protein